MSKSSNTLPPGTPTPRSGIYEQVGPRGGRTGGQAGSTRGHPLPPTEKPGHRLKFAEEPCAGPARHTRRASRPEDGPHAPELAATTLRALAIPEIAACRSRLLPELTVFSAQANDDRAIYVGGVADAVAYQPRGAIDLVVDWKTDVTPSAQQIDLYRE